MKVVPKLPSLAAAASNHNRQGGSLGSPNVSVTSTLRGGGGASASVVSEG